tara:strand:- start:47 stop:331 length:285 start_codon:yes stop_codon:yes gene_type:complete
MKNLINKYFDFIGIENEGWRRISIIFIVLMIFPIPPLVIKGEDFDDLIEEIVELIVFHHGVEGFLFYWGYVLLQITILSVLIKTFNWVKDGFSK